MVNQGPLKYAPKRSVVMSSLFSHPIGQQVVSVETLREDSELQSFFRNLVSTYLNIESQYVRIDLLLNPVGQNAPGIQLLGKLKECLGLPVFASHDILGACLSESGGMEGKR